MFVPGTPLTGILLLGERLLLKGQWKVQDHLLGIGGIVLLTGLSSELGLIVLTVQVAGGSVGLC